MGQAPLCAKVIRQFNSVHWLPWFNGVMAPKRRGDAKLVHVLAEHVPAPEAQERLARAYAIILRAAARAVEAPHEESKEGSL